MLHHEPLLRLLKQGKKKGKRERERPWKRQRQKIYRDK